MKSFVLRVISATNLSKMDVVGGADPYCNVTVGDRITVKSPEVPSTLNPTWNFSVPFQLEDDAKSTVVHITVMDRDVGSADDVIGFVVFDLFGIKHGEAVVLSMKYPTGAPLSYKKGKVDVFATITVQADFDGYLSDQPASAAAGAAAMAVPVAASAVAVPAAAPVRTPQGLPEMPKGPRVSQPKSTRVVQATPIPPKEEEYEYYYDDEEVPAAPPPPSARPLPKAPQPKVSVVAAVAPPPPPPPPPPSVPVLAAAPPAPAAGAGTGRGALLADIRNGTRLKKVAAVSTDPNAAPKRPARKTQADSIQDAISVAMANRRPNIESMAGKSDAGW